MGCNGSKEEASMSSANPLLWATPEMFRNDFSDTIAASDKAKIYNLICGSSHTKGGRAYMEDIDVQFDAIHIAPTAYVSLYGIFDGHGGRDCAVYVSKYLPIRIFANLKNPAKQSAEVVYSAFREVDREWLNVANNDAGKMKDAGSTGTIFVWRSDESRGYVANVGDTRAVLCRRGRAIDMTKDHKATDPEVIEQVTQRGGFVNNNRINGILAVGRGFGDAYLKTPRVKEDLLSNAPDVITYTPQTHDAFLLIASDGLWDVLSSTDAVRRVYSYLQTSGIFGTLRGNGGKMTPPEAADMKEKLRDYAYQLARYATRSLNSRDNITVMIILLLPLPESTSEELPQLPASVVVKQEEIVFSDPSVLEDETADEAVVPVETTSDAEST